MKNLTLKKVAIGLLLAGYSISSAYAANTATLTTATIKGHAPLINSINKEDFANNAIDIAIIDVSGNEMTTIDKDNPITDGYKVKISFKVADKDGDKDSKVLTGNTVRFGYTNSNTNKFVWENGNNPKTENGVTSVEWTIPLEAIGSKIYYQVRPTTDYGYPRQAEKFVYGNVLNKSKAPKQQEEKDKDAKPDEKDGKDTGTGGGGGPEIPEDQQEIKPNKDSFVFTLYKAKVENGVVVYGDKVSSSDNPIVGETFAPKLITKTGVDITSTLAYTWSLVNYTSPTNDVNEKAKDVVGLLATNAKVTANADKATTGLVYTIPAGQKVQTADKNEVTGLFAGAQGFKLKVEGTR